MTTPAERITRFRATPDIRAFLKVRSVGELRQLTRSYRSSHGLQESDGRTMYPKKKLIANLVAAEGDRRERSSSQRGAIQTLLPPAATAGHCRAIDQNPDCAIPVPKDSLPHA